MFSPADKDNWDKLLAVELIAAKDTTMFSIRMVFPLRVTEYLHSKAIAFMNTFSSLSKWQWLECFFLSFEISPAHLCCTIVYVITVMRSHWTKNKKKYLESMKMFYKTCDYGK